MSMISARYLCKYVPGSGTPQVGRTWQMIYLFPLLSIILFNFCVCLMFCFSVRFAPPQMLWCGGGGGGGGRGLPQMICLFPTSNGSLLHILISFTLPTSVPFSSPYKPHITSFGSNKPWQIGQKNSYSLGITVAYILKVKWSLLYSPNK